MTKEHGIPMLEIDSRPSPAASLHNELTGTMSGLVDSEEIKELRKEDSVGVHCASCAEWRKFGQEKERRFIERGIQITALEAEIKWKTELLDEQKRTIAALNSCIGGEESTTTENIIRVDRLEAENAQLRAIIYDGLAALDNGAFGTEECSVEFLSEVPKEIRMEVTAKKVAIAKQAEEISELKSENTAIRTLMNSYNLGGWTDSLRCVQDLQTTIEQQAAEIERLKNDRSTGFINMQLERDLAEAQATIAALEAEKKTIAQANYDNQCELQDRINELEENGPTIVRGETADGKTVFGTMRRVLADTEMAADSEARHADEMVAENAKLRSLINEVIGRLSDGIK